MTRWVCWWKVHIRFQSTLPRREWLSANLFILPRWTFQSALPRRVWQIDQKTVTRDMEFQSALLCKEWRRLLGLSQQFSKISIRTPTQGVTISNYIINIYISISIHSPTQGVTCRRNNKLPLPYFNPLSHAGSDGSGAGARSYPCQFQSTLPRWEWRGCWFCPNARDCISIHSPTLGVTRYRPGEPGGGPISIHTPTLGVTDRHHYGSLVDKNFNPHSHAGSDWHCGQSHTSNVISIHTPMQGVTTHSNFKTQIE